MCNLTTTSCFFILILPPTIMATVRPPKRRRTGHQLPPMVEGSDMSLNTAIYIHSKGDQRILVPVQLHDVQVNAPTQTEPEPQLDDLHEFEQPPDIEMNVDE